MHGITGPSLFMLQAGLLVLAIVCYCLYSFGQMRIAGKLDYRYPFFAWIPFLNTYQLGEIAKPEIKRNRNIGRHFIYDNLGAFLVSMQVIGIILTIARSITRSIAGYLLLSLILCVIEIVILCYSIIAVYHVYRRFAGDRAAGFTVLYVFLSFVAMPVVSGREPIPVVEGEATDHDVFRI